MNRFLGIVVGLGFFLPANAVQARICINDGLAPTLREQARNASAILYGYVVRSERRTKEGEHGSDFHILDVLKSHPVVGKKKVIYLPRQIEVKDPRNPPRFIIFCDIYKNELDPWRGIPVDSQGVVQYLQQAMALGEKDRVKALAHFFSYLGHENHEVNQDALREFLKANFRDLRAAARHFDPDRIQGLMQPPHPPHFRETLALMLGACGTDKHARFLRECLTDRENEGRSGHLLIGYTLLKPAEGLSCMQALVRNPGNSFLARYSVRQASVFLVKNAPEALARKDLVALLLPTLEQEDLADLVINTFRDWKAWECHEKILTLGQWRPLNPITHRAVLCYALRCPEPRASQFVREQRRRDPTWVREVEEVLELEEGGQARSGGAKK